MDIRKETYRNSELIKCTLYNREEVTLSILNNIPLDLLTRIDGDKTFLKIDEILETHRLVRSFTQCTDNGTDRPFIWKNPEALYNFLTNEYTEIDKVATIVPQKRVRNMLDNGYGLGVELAGTSKRLMTLDVEAYRESRVKRSPFFFDIIPKNFLIQDKDLDINFAIVYARQLNRNDLIRTQGRLSYKVLNQINKDRTDVYLELFSNSNLDDELNTLINLVKFCRRHKTEFHRRGIRRLIIMKPISKGVRLELPREYRKIMDCQELNKHIYALSPMYT